MKVGDEIAALARQYLEDPHSDGVIEVDRVIAAAAAESRWDDVSKWHRVRLRLLRFRAQRYVEARFAPVDSRVSRG